MMLFIPEVEYGGGRHVAYVSIGIMLLTGSWFEASKTESLLLDCSVIKCCKGIENQFRYAAIERTCCYPSQDQYWSLLIEANTITNLWTGNKRGDNIHVPRQSGAYT